MSNQELEALFSDVEETGLLTLYCKAIESQTDDPIIRDEKAVKMIKELDPILAEADSRLLQRLAARKLDPRIIVHIALRAKRYDEYTTAFLSQHPDGVVVNMGSGLAPRFYRIDNGKARYFDVDLPQVITFKRALLKEEKRYQMLSSSVFEDGWKDKVAAVKSSNYLFMAEGVFMYLDPQKVKDLVLDLQKRFPGSELVCEVVQKKWAQGFRQKIGAMKMRNRFNIGESAGFHFGLDQPAEMEEWNEGIEFLDAWSYFDSGHEKLGWMRVFGKSKLMREMQYTVHYKLH